MSSYHHSQWQGPKFVDRVGQGSAHYAQVLSWDTEIHRSCWLRRKRSRTCSLVFKDRPDTGNEQDPGRGTMTKEQAHLHTSVSEAPGPTPALHLLAVWLHLPEPSFLLELQEVTFVCSPKHSKLSVNGRSSNKVIMIFASHSSPSSLSSKFVQKSHCSTGPPGCLPARGTKRGQSNHMYPLKLHTPEAWVTTTSSLTRHSRWPDGSVEAFTGLQVRIFLFPPEQIEKQDGEEKSCL